MIQQRVRGADAPFQNDRLAPQRAEARRIDHLCGKGRIGRRAHRAPQHEQACASEDEPKGTEGQWTFLARTIGSRGLDDQNFTRRITKRGIALMAVITACHTAGA